MKGCDIEMALVDFLRGIADAIRIKSGTEEAIVAKDFPQRILDIPSGGLPENIKTGTFTVAEDTTETITIPHGLGTDESVIVLIFPDNPEYSIGKIAYSILGGINRSGEKIVTGNSGAVTSKYGICAIDVDDTNIVITPSGSTYKLIAGLNYRWYIWEVSA